MSPLSGDQLAGGSAGMAFTGENALAPWLCVTAFRRLCSEAAHLTGCALPAPGARPTIILGESVRDKVLKALEYDGSHHCLSLTKVLNGNVIRVTNEVSHTVRKLTPPIWHQSSGERNARAGGRQGFRAHMMQRAVYWTTTVREEGHAMRIGLMIETDGQAGAEIMTLDLGRALRERGHEVHYVGPAHNEGWGREQYAAAKFPSHLFTHRPPFDPRCAQWLTRVVRDNKLDVMHAHEFLLIVYGAIASLMTGVPLVATVHGNPEMTAAARRRMALRLALRRAKAVVAVSSATERDVRDKIGVLSHMQQIPNGVRFSKGTRERVRAELSISPDELLFIGVGTLTTRKGFIHLLEALATLPADMPWRAAIAGRPHDAHESLVTFIREKHWEGRVHLLGPRSDVPDVQAAADVFVMPSLWEGLPLALLEAMFAGKAIVATRTQGIPEAIDDEEQGLLCDPGDTAGLASQLRRVATDAELRERLGKAALVRAEERFAHSRMTDRYEDLYLKATALR